MVFRRLADSQVVDILPYAQDFLTENPNHKLYVGTDSQNIGKTTVYATVIVFHSSRGGGHVLYSKVVLPKITDRWTRLWKEVEMSVETAELLKDTEHPVDFIDLDMNPDPKYKSNSVLRSAVGYVESLGYVARVKPDATIASCVADKIFR